MQEIPKYTGDSDEDWQEWLTANLPKMEENRKQMILDDEEGVKIANIAYLELKPIFAKYFPSLIDMLENEVENGIYPCYCLSIVFVDNIKHNSQSKLELFFDDFEVWFNNIIINTENTPKFNHFIKNWIEVTFFEFIFDYHKDLFKRLYNNSNGHFRKLFEKFILEEKIDI